MSFRVVPFRRAGRETATDSDLVAACATGDPAAVEELFRRHGDLVRRALILLGEVGKEVVGDVLLRTFLEICRTAHRFDDSVPARIWMLGMATDVARRLAARRGPRRKALKAAEKPYGNDEKYAHTRAEARLRAGFDQLPKRLRAVFALCDLEGMRGVDVAHVLDIRERTVWRRLDRARKRLRKQLDGRAQSTGLLSRYRGCPPDWVLTRAVSAGAEPTVATHLESCPRCSGTFNLLDDVANRAAIGFPSPEAMTEAERDAISIRLLASRQAAVAEPRTALPWLVALVLTISLAALGYVVAQWRHS